MFSIIGILVVFGAVVAGYLMEHGNLRVLMQPAELVIIGGASIGTVLVANPLHILKKIASGITGVFTGSKFSKQVYIDSLKTMYELVNRARKDGLMALEADVEEPEKSAILSKDRTLMKNHHARDFVCDSLRMAVTGMDAFDLDQVLDLDMEVHHRDSEQPTTALSTMADSLPGLGIVAAVLGVVITMGALGGPPEEIGHKVAAALVGTFLGILLCYGLVGPIAQNMTKAAEEEHACLPLRLARDDDFFPERHGSDHGGGSGAQGGAGTCSAVVQGTRGGMPRCTSRGCRPGSRRGRGLAIMENTRPIIIIKKKGGHGGHHGGAWKVAYADFVTAMMALFIVLWLLNSSKQIQVAVGGYFKDPTGTAKEVGSTLTGTGESVTLTRDNMPKLKEQLETAIREMNDFEKLKSHIEMTVTDEGLRIELTESAAGTFFNTGSDSLNADGRELLITLAKELGQLPNKISIEGHTDATPYATMANYGNWELSADRANAARRLVQNAGIREDQVTQVRGFADQRLRKRESPLDPSNRRISLIVQYVVINSPGKDKKASPGESAPAKESAVPAEGPSKKE